jgi:hypothetical protein
MTLKPGYDFVYYTLYRGGKEVLPEDLPQEEQDRLFDLTNLYAKLLEECECFDHPGSTNMLRITWRDVHPTVLASCCCPLRCMQLEFVTKRHQIPLELTHLAEKEPLSPGALRARFLQWFSDHFEIELPGTDSGPPSQG